jgi:cell division protease FtsH
MDSDAVLFTASDLFGKLAIAYGGLAAEELVLGEASTGAEQDLEHATGLAREIVGRFGMSERIGRVRLFASDADEYLGAASGLETLSERTHEDFDAEVRALLDAAEANARKVLQRNRDLLDRLAERLLDAETLEGDALAAALSDVQ